MANSKQVMDIRPNSEGNPEKNTGTRKHDIHTVYKRGVVHTEHNLREKHA